MIKNTGLIFTFIGFLACLGFTQPDSEQFICWNLENDLMWDDFNGNVRRSETYVGLNGAASKIRICISYFLEGDTLHYLVLNRFSKTESWVLKQNMENQQLLQHERLHFDIAEIYARKIRRRLYNVRFDSNKTQFENDIDSLLNKRREVEARYDFETGHGISKEHQEQWSQLVKDELSQLEEYALNEEGCRCL